MSACYILIYLAANKLTSTIYLLLSHSLIISATVFSVFSVARKLYIKLGGNPRKLLTIHICNYRFLLKPLGKSLFITTTRMDDLYSTLKVVLHTRYPQF